MRNSVSAVAARPVATSAVPMPATHSGPSRCTIATEPPGVFVSFKIFSIFCRSSAMDCGGLCDSSFFSAEHPSEDEITTRATPVRRFMFWILPQVRTQAQSLFTDDSLGFASSSIRFEWITGRSQVGVRLSTLTENALPAEMRLQLRADRRRYGKYSWSRKIVSVLLVTRPVCIANFPERRFL